MLQGNKITLEEKGAKKVNTKAGTKWGVRHRKEEREVLPVAVFLKERWGKKNCVRSYGSECRIVV